MRKQERHRRRGAHKWASVAAATVSAMVPATSAAQAPLPEPVIEALHLALADERHALATYTTVLDRFGDVRPFINIARAEQRHIDALLPLYKRYRVPVPADDTRIDPRTTTLDLKGLCEIGVAAEIENVRLYDEDLLPRVQNYPDIARVLNALRDASANNHLPAFQRCVARSGRPGHGAGGGRK
jgi:hypothetical protein